MNRFSTGDFTGRNNGGYVEIRILSRWWANAHAFIGQLHMHGISIGSGMNRNSLNAKFTRSAQNPKGNLAAISNENFVEHYSITISTSPNSTGCAFSTLIFTTLPALGATI